MKNTTILSALISTGISAAISIITFILDHFLSYKSFKRQEKYQLLFEKANNVIDGLNIMHRDIISLRNEFQPVYKYLHHEDYNPKEPTNYSNEVIQSIIKTTMEMPGYEEFSKNALYFPQFQQNVRKIEKEYESLYWHVQGAYIQHKVRNGRTDYQSWERSDKVYNTVVGKTNKIILHIDQNILGLKESFEGEIQKYSSKLKL